MGKGIPGEGTVMTKEEVPLVRGSVQPEGRHAQDPKGKWTKATREGETSSAALEVWPRPLRHKTLSMGQHLS